MDLKQRELTGGLPADAHGRRADLPTTRTTQVPKRARRIFPGRLRAFTAALNHQYQAEN